MKKYPFKSIRLDKWTDGEPPESLIRYLLRGLVSYPYFIRLSGFPVGYGNADHLSSLILALEKRVGAVSPKRMSYTAVTINDNQAGKDRPVTAYSRTSEALAPHTDSTYLPNPHDVVAFQCEVADVIGGATYMVAVDDIIENLDSPLRRSLSESHFDFGRGKHAILHTGGDGQTEIRYYRAQIDHIAMRHQAQLPMNVQHVLDQLDQVLMQSDLAFRFKLMPGEAVIMHNKRVMHARDSFDDGSDRVFYRIRRHLNLSSVATKAPVFHDVVGWLTSIWVKRQTASGTVPVQGQGPDVDTLTTARTATRLGDFANAQKLYTQLLDQNPYHYEALQALSALLYRDQKLEQAEGYRRLFCEHHPFSRIPKSRQHLPTVLKARALKGIKYTYKKGQGGYKRTLQRGHFSLTSLFNEQFCFLQNLNIYDESVPVMEPAPQGVNLLINTIACGDRMANSLAALGQFLEANPKLAVINDPLHVAKTTRGENYKVLGLLPGVTFPRTEAIDHDGSSGSIENIKALIKAGFEFPVMIRPRFTHTGGGLELIRSLDEVEPYFSRNSEESCFYIIQWKNLRTPEGLYNKIRTFCIDGTYYPIAHLMHTDWNVHSGDRYSVMHKKPALQAMEKAYLADMPSFMGPPAMQALERIREKVALDFFGIDFALLGDGSLYIFECNAAMRHNYDHATAFPYTRPSLDAATNAFQSMVQTRLA